MREAEMCLMMQKMGDGIREDGLVRAMIKRGEKRGGEHNCAPHI